MTERLTLLVEGLLSLTTAKLLLELARLLRNSALVLVSFGYATRGVRSIQEAMS